MNFISKDCVVFLAWTIVGVMLYLGSICAGIYKLWKLNPNDTHTGLEYFHRLMDEAYAIMGAPSPGRTADRKDGDEVSNLETVVLLLGCGMIWPVLVAVVLQAAKNVHDELKMEYDRGIRVRKKPS